KGMKFGSVTSASAASRKALMRHTVLPLQGPGRMKVKIAGDHEAMSRAAAGWLAREFERNPRLLVCLAAGATPARTYELLGVQARKSPAFFHQLQVVKLDEWAGLTRSDPASCDAFLRQRVIR